MLGIEHTIEVRWRHRIYFTEHTFSPDNPRLRDLLAETKEAGPARVLFVVDEALGRDVLVLLFVHVSIMDRRYNSPQELLKLLKFEWIGRIERGVSVTITSTVYGRNLELVATWGNGQSYQKAYFDPQKKPCYYARDFMQSLLEARGVI